MAALEKLFMGKQLNMGKAGFKIKAIKEYISTYYKVKA